MRYGLEANRLRHCHFSIPTARRRKDAIWLGTYSTLARQCRMRESLSDWQVALWVVCGEFACAVTVISHNLTCIPPYLMVQSWEREGGWWDGTLVNVSCLRSNNLRGILSLLSLCECVCVYACVRALCTIGTWSLEEQFHLSVQFGKVAIIILVAVTTFCNHSVSVWSEVTWIAEVVVSPGTSRLVWWGWALVDVGRNEGGKRKQWDKRRVRKMEWRQNSVLMW